MPHVVVVGGGFGGLTCAQALAAMPVEVTLVDRTNHHLFQPLLYQVAMAGLSPADIAVPIRSVLDHQANVRVLLGEAVSVDAGARTIALDHGLTLSWDYLVLAVGARTSWFGHDDWATHALGMKNLDDALAVRRRVLLSFEAAEREEDPEARRRLLTFVVIGGGPTGVELAGSLAELGRFAVASDFRRIRGELPRVVLVEAAGRLLPGGFDPSLSEAARRQLVELGVDVRLGVRVEDIDARGVRLTTGMVESTTVLWSAGVAAESLVGTLGLPTDTAGRVAVRCDCSLPGHPDVFVVGDAASFVPEGAAAPLPGVSPVAMQEARFVAGRIAARLRGDDRVATFRYVDKGIMATVGRSRAVVQLGPLRLHGFLAWVGWLALHVWFLIGFRNRLVVMVDWAWSWLTYDRGARLITGGHAPDHARELAARAEAAAISTTTRSTRRAAPRA